MADEHRLRIYEQIAKQIEREDNLYQTRLNSCIVVNLALLAATATQVNLPGLGLKNLVIILGCSAAGFMITRGFRLAIADGDTQLAYLWSRFSALEGDPDHGLVRPYMAGGGGHRWASVTLVFQWMWAAIALFALLVFLISHTSLREYPIWQRLTSTLS